MTSETDIANLALSEIGAKLIASLQTENSEEARVCRLHFIPVRDGLLRQHLWNFAITRQSLSAIAGAATGDWDTAWQAPADMVRLIRIETGNADVPLKDFALEGRRILTRSTTSPSLQYVSNAAPVTEWDSLFVEAMSYALAGKIAGPLTQSPSLSNDCLTKLRKLALPAAQTIDAREVKSGENSGWRQLRNNSPLVQSRFRC